MDAPAKRRARAGSKVDTLEAAMKPTLRHAVAAALAASAFSIAHAETYVSAPVASTSRADGAGADVAKAVADALNADSSFKDTKITVAIDEAGNIVLTGATPTQADVQRIAQVAAQAGNNAKVVNVIQADH